ncbi:MAG: hypothetical protein ACI9DF_005855 [Verrucomicrobiales bacterium]|jgi:hypothetical protein
MLFPLTVTMSDHEPAKPQAQQGDPTHLPSGDVEDLIVAALDHLRGSLERDGGAYWQDSSPRQKVILLEWASRLGLLLDANEYASRLQRGGQEHDVFIEGDRYIKATRNDVFGFMPGIELGLVSSSQDARRFHLWEASPYRYLNLN